jgi:hypothetical protein
MSKTGFGKAFDKSYKTFRAIRRARTGPTDAASLDFKGAVSALKVDYPEMTDEAIAEVLEGAARLIGETVKR